MTDSNLTFENYVNSICKKASQKLNVLARIVTQMNIHKRRTIIKSSVTSQFGYFLLIWMCHKRRLNNKINSIRERDLQDNTSTFQVLLIKDNSVSRQYDHLGSLLLSFLLLLLFLIVIIFSVRADFNQHHELRSASNFWCQRCNACI